MAYEGMALDELAAKFGGVAVGGADDDLTKLARSFGAKPVGQPLTVLEGAQALSTGFNRGVASLAGLPVKAALDVADLARAGVGYLGSKAGILSPDQLPTPLDRSRFVGSPEYILDRIASNPVGAAAIVNPRSDDPTARLLNASGAGVGVAMSGRPADIAMQAASGMTGQLATEAGATPEWAMVASMGPQLAATGTPAALRGAMRGGDQGRKEMQDLLADFERAGVDPTVGLATGNRRTQAIESLLSKAPGSAGVMASKAEQLQAQMQAAANAARDRVSPVYGPAAAGDAVRQGIEAYRQRQQDVYGRIQDRALSMIPEDMTFPVGAMLSRGNATLAEIPGAPNVSKVLNEPLGMTQRVVGALERDAAGMPAGQLPSAILMENGQPFMTQLPATPGGIPFEGIKGLKTRIGQAAYADNPLLADQNTAALKHLYSGAKSDLLTAGALADVERVSRGQQPGVLRELQRGDKFYAQTQTILEKVLSPIYKAGESASERTYLRIEGESRNSGQTVSRLMASLPLEARKQVTATAIDRLGKAAPGQQNAEGSQFSGLTFLANWNRMTPEARSGLFLTIPNGGTVKDRLDSLAKVAEWMRDASKVYANPSGTSQATNLAGAATGMIGGAAGIATGNASIGTAMLGTVLGSMATANWGAKLMTSPKFVTWLSGTTMVRPERMREHLQRLNLTATQERDPETRAALEGFANELSLELGQR